MKTVKQVWTLRSGSWFDTFESPSDMMLALSDPEYLSSFPDGTILTPSPSYEIVDFEVPGNEYYNPPQTPLMLN
jgi:hypothetical protein